MNPEKIRHDFVKEYEREAKESNKKQAKLLKVKYKNKINKLKK
jgi:hypothetical protein